MLSKLLAKASKRAKSPRSDPNAGFLSGARDFALTARDITEVQRDQIINNYSINLAPPAPPASILPPLPPLKHSSTMFIGQDRYLDRLKEHFGQNEAGQRKSFLLYGIGGIGKTQICLKFIEQNAQLFSDIFWIDASSEETIDLALRQIASAHNVTSGATVDSATLALKWISQRVNWLIIYDNANGGYEIVEKHLPSGNTGNIFITSRNPALQRITLAKNSIEVLEMEEDEAVSLLLESASLGGSSDHLVQSRQLVLKMGGIPLALDQAGSYIQTCCCRIEDYLDMFSKHQEKLMSGAKFKGASNYGASIYGTWEISMQEIETRAAITTGLEAVAAQSAITLMQICAFIHHANIPEELFKNAAENYVKRDLKKGTKPPLPVSAALLDSQTLFLSEDCEWDRMQFLAGIQVLFSFSLIRSKNAQYFIHPLVHSWSRNRISKKEALTCYWKARALLSCSIEPDYGLDNHVFCQLLAAHIESNHQYEIDKKMKSVYYDDEHDAFAFVFDRIGRWNEAEKLLVDMVTAREAKLGSDHPVTLTGMTSLARTYRSQGRWKEAEKLQLDVVRATKAKLGSDHTDTLAGMYSLAQIYSNQGRWDEAEVLQLDVLKATKAELGSDHPVTLTSMNSLALTYKYQGRRNEAEKLQLDVLKAMKAKLGLDHPDTLASMHNLSLTYGDQQRWNEAEKLQLDVVKAIKAKLGSDHPDTLTSKNNLAWIYSNQGRWNEAEKLQLDVLKATEAKLGSDHPDTLTNMHTLALTYRSQGRWNEAEKLLLDVVKATKAKLGSDHTDTLVRTANLAIIYMSQDRWNEAESILTNVVKLMHQVMGVQHPTTLNYQEHLNELHQKIYTSDHRHETAKGEGEGEKDGRERDSMPSVTGH